MTRATVVAGTSKTGWVLSATLPVAGVPQEAALRAYAGLPPVTSPVDPEPTAFVPSPRCVMPAIPDERIAFLPASFSAIGSLLGLGRAAERVAATGGGRLLEHGGGDAVALRGLGAA